MPIVDGFASDEVAVVALVRGDEVVCSGSVIAAHAVLTAAHCLIGSELPDVIVGGERRTPVAKRESPTFDATTLASDVAILVFDPPLSVAPLPYAWAPTFAAGSTADIIGFGRTSANEPAAWPPVQRRGTSVIDVVDVDTFRTSSPQRTCEGDSGGPALLDGTIIGVTSSGDPGCAVFSRFTRVDRAFYAILEAVRATAPGEATAGAQCWYPANCGEGECLPALDDPERTYCTPSCAGGCAEVLACIDGLCRWPAPSPGADGALCTFDRDCTSDLCASPADRFGSVCAQACFSDLPGFACPSGMDCRPTMLDGQEACFQKRDDGCATSRPSSILLVLLALGQLLRGRGRP